MMRSPLRGIESYLRNTIWCHKLPFLDQRLTNDTQQPNKNKRRRTSR